MVQKVGLVTLYLLIGISSRPPREFSLMSAGTKSPGQVRSQVPGGFRPKWRRAAEDHGVKFSLEETYDFGRANGTLKQTFRNCLEYRGLRFTPADFFKPAPTSHSLTSPRGI